MTGSHVLVYSEETALFPRIAASLPGDVSATYLTDPHEFRAARYERPPAAVIFVIPGNSGRWMADTGIIEDGLAGVPLILIVRDEVLHVSYLDALVRLRPVALVSSAFESESLRGILRRELADAAPHSEEDLQAILADANQRLNARLQEINTIYTIGKSVIASLDVNEILERVTGAAVNLTQAEEGFIILREGEQLFTRVRKVPEGRFAERCHEETHDSIAWQVINSGRPALLQRQTKLATDLVVNGLLYVPLQIPERGTMGVLGLINRQRSRTFSEHQLLALSSAADFAAIALEKARLFSLQAAERSRLSAILRDAAEALIVTDDTNRLWLWSDTAAQIFDIGPEARGCYINDCVANLELCELFEASNRNQAVLHREVTLKDGRVFNAQLSTIDRVGRLAVMQEITHLKELDRLKSEFVSTVSHDLRTPLTTIQGYVELLDRVGPLNEMQTKFVGKAMTSLSHITALISDLLDIGRIEAGYDLEMQPVRIDELIRLTAEAEGVVAAPLGIDVTVELEQPPLWVWGNAHRLRQVLDNLISNAIKYNRSPGWVRVSGKRVGDHTIVTVSDGGIGIPLDEQPRLFERFYRVQTPETEGIMGTGLGLAIVKSVVEKHQGRVWVESVPGQGSTFAFLLPTHTPSA